jgi:TonB family protein
LNVRQKTMRVLFTLAVFGFVSLNVGANPLPWQEPHSVTLKYVSEGAKGQLTWLSTLYPASWPLPAYPIEVLRAGIREGSAILRFTVKEDCSIADIEVVRSPIPELGASSKEAVARWKFVRPPGSKVMQWTPTIVECRFDFRVHDE